jgi:hypothetical protein
MSIILVYDNQWMDAKTLRSLIGLPTWSDPSEPQEEEQTLKSLRGSKYVGENPGHFARQGCMQQYERHEVCPKCSWTALRCSKACHSHFV